MKIQQYKTREEASAALNKEFPNGAPIDIYYTYLEGEIEYDVWSGRRRFHHYPDNYWTSNMFVCFNKNASRLHLGDYWGEQAGIYSKE